MKTAFILQAAEAVQQALLDHESEIESLDRAIGDGDHLINMKRGSATIVGLRSLQSGQVQANWRRLRRMRHCRR